MTEEELREAAKAIVPNDDAREHWINTPNALLGDRSPLECINQANQRGISDGPSEQDVVGIIEAFRDGGFDWTPFDEGVPK